MPGVPLPAKGKSSSAKQQAQGKPNKPLEDPSSLKLPPGAEPVNSYSNPFLEPGSPFIDDKGDLDVFKGNEHPIQELGEQKAEEQAVVILEKTEDAVISLWDKLVGVFDSIINFLEDHWFELLLAAGFILLGIFAIFKFLL